MAKIVALDKKATKQQNVSKSGGGRKNQSRRSQRRKISDISFNIGALSASRVSTPKARKAKVRRESRLAASTRSVIGVKRKPADQNDLATKSEPMVTQKAASSAGSSGPPAKKARLPAGNRLQKSCSDLGSLFKNDHVVSPQQVSGLSSLPSVEDLPGATLSAAENPPPESEKSVILIDSDDEEENISELESGEIVSTLVEEVGQEFLAVVDTGRSTSLCYFSQLNEHIWRNSCWDGGGRCRAPAI
jgi:hypothetical protein